MHGRRAVRQSVVGAVGAAALALPGVTHAQTAVTIDGRVAAPGGGKATMLQISGGQRNADGTQPPTVSELVLYFPRQLRLDQTGVARCSAAALETGGPGACASASRIGTGSVTAQAGAIIAKPTLTLFNGARNRILLYVHLTAPIQIGQPIEARLSRASGPYGVKLTIPVPQNLQRPIASLPAAITDISATVGRLVPTTGRPRRRSLLTRGACGPTGKLAFKAVMTLADGGTQEAAGATPCR